MKNLLIFSTLAGWICVILHILVVLIVLDHLTTRKYLTWGQNGPKWGQLCEKNMKILILDYFFEFECKTTLTILLKLSKMVDDNERDHPWKFQVQKKPGSFRRGPIISILADYDSTNCSGLSHNHVLPVSKASLWKIRPVSVKSVKIWPSTFDSVPRVPPRLGLLTLSRSLWDVTVLNVSWG